MNDAFQINSKDNVATALKDLVAGQCIIVTGIRPELKLSVVENVPAGHKVATCDILKGEAVIKYGEVIGTATADIAAGRKVHVHNVEGRRGRGDLK